MLPCTLCPIVYWQVLTIGNSRHQDILSNFYFDDSVLKTRTNWFSFLYCNARARPKSVIRWNLDNESLRNCTPWPLGVLTCSSVRLGFIFLLKIPQFSTCHCKKHPTTHNNQIYALSFFSAEKEAPLPTRLSLATVGRSLDPGVFSGSPTMTSLLGLRYDRSKITRNT